MFKTYKRKGLSEMIPYVDFQGDLNKVSVSEPDKNLSDEEFKKGFIARNPKNHEDLWYVSKKYFDDNLQETDQGDSPGPYGLLHLGKGTFGMAVEAAKKGKLIARSGWNGKGMFVFVIPSDTLSADFIINKVKSLPQSLKDYYFKQFSFSEGEKERGNDPESYLVTFTEYFCMKAADGTIVNGWLASQTDMLAEDWIIIE